MPYIGNQHIVGDHINNFKVLDDISSYTETFNGASTNVVSTSDDTIRIPEHRFIHGQRVTYTNGGGGNIGGLTSGQIYFITFHTKNTIKLATNLQNANNNVFVNLSSVGSGTSHTINAAFDGVNTKFKITYEGGKEGRFNNATQLNIAINNVIQRPNLNPITFTEGFAIEDHHKIIFKVAPTVNDIFWGSIIANTIENFDLRDNEVDNFTGDGSATEFTLSTIPANNESVIVTIDGVLQHPSDKNVSRAYTLIDSVIQFTAAPALNAEIQVRHIGFAGASTADVSGFYGRTGNVTLTANDHITTGDITSRNINASGIVTASTFDGAFTGNVVGTSATFTGNLTVGGVLTYEDVTNIDSIGIVTAQKDIHVGAGLSVVGVATFSDHIILKGTNPRITFTDTDSNPDFQIFGSGGNLNIWDATNNASRLLINSNGHIDVGHLDVLNGLSVGGNATFADDIDVDGHTELDNLRVVGVSTFDNGAVNIINGGGAYNTHLNYNDSGINYITSTNGGGTYFRGSSNSVTAMVVQGSGPVDIDGDLRHLGDTNTMLKFGTDTISFETGGSQRLQISSSGNVTAGSENSVMGVDDSNVLRVGLFKKAGLYPGIAAANNAPIIFYHSNTTNIASPASQTYTERVRIAPNGQITQTAASGDTVLTLKRSDANTTGLTGGINFAASDGHSVASIQARGDGDNEGAHLQFYTTTAAAGDIFNAANVERLRITSDGKVGIGTNNPSLLLHLHQDNSNATFAHFTNTSTGVNANQGVSFGLDSNEDATIYHYGSKNIRFATGGTEKVRIESGGGLKFTGQGTSIPVGGILHHTNNNLYVRGGTNGLILSNDNNYTTIQIYDTYIKFETNDGTEKLRLTSTGRLGIGESSPDNTLHITKDGSNHGIKLERTGTNAGSATINCNSFGALSLTAGNNLALYSGASQQIIFYRGASNEVARFDTSGRLLIGTTNTDTVGTVNQNVVIGSTTNGHEAGLTLNVMEGTNNRRAKFFLDDNDGVFGVDATASTGVPPFVVRIATSEKLRITSGGEVGIRPGGITPTAGDLATGDSQNTPLLHVSGQGTSDTGGVYNLLARFQAGGDSDGSGAMIVINHGNDRGLAIQGGRRTGNYAHGALKMIDNIGRLSSALVIHGGPGQGIDHQSFYTGNSTTTTERFHLGSTGNFAFYNNGGDNRIERNTTSGGPYLLFHNRGTNTTDSSGVYNLGGISAAGYRDVANPGIVGSMQFVRQPTAGGASSGCDIIFRTGFNGTTSHTAMSERMRISYTGAISSAVTRQALSYTALATPTYYTHSGTGNTNVTIDVSSVFGVPDNAKAILVQGWYHVSGYAQGNAGQADHATSHFSERAHSGSSPWSFTTSTNTGWGQYVMDHDGDASGSPLHYGMWGGQGVVNVNPNGNIYGALYWGYSGGTHYNQLWCFGYYM